MIKLALVSVAILVSAQQMALGAPVEFVGQDKTLQVFGIKMVGINPDNGTKLLLTLATIAVIWLLGRLLKAIARLLLRGREDIRARFWSDQAVHMVTTLLLFLLLISIWFSDPARLATVFGLVSAGLAFALQKVITAFAAYFVILRGRLFNVGDRIKMGGVRGDVIALGYLRTTVMEMGQPPGEQQDNPSMWVESRQYTGRIVTVTNDKIFNEPVYNYSRKFPYIWEEMHIPIPYRADRTTAERIILEAARRHTVAIGELSAEALHDLQRRYPIERADLKPHVYFRMTDNWLELAVRFIAPAHGIRELKDKMTREILSAFDHAGITIASTTYEIVGVPPLRIQR